MTTPVPTSHDREKVHAARAALEFLEDGMVLGIGTGSTVNVLIELLGSERWPAVAGRGFEFRCLLCAPAGPRHGGARAQ